MNPPEPATREEALDQLTAEAEKLGLYPHPLPAPKSPYFSFLLCSHQSGALINVYINGLPIGVITNGVWRPHELTLPTGRKPVTIRELADPFPFETVAEMKVALHRAVNAIEVGDTP